MLLVSEASLPSTPARRRASLGRTLSVLVVALAAGTLGCGIVGPRPTSVATPAPAPAVAKKEPYLVLRLSERRVYLKDDDLVPSSPGFPVAIGRPRYPTPTGRFRIVEMVKNPDFVVFDFSNPKGRDLGRIPPGLGNPLGLRWIAFTEAHGWVIGFHGTTKTELLGQAVSHGCVRMRNDDIVKVFDRVKLGTPVIVEP